MEGVMAFIRIRTIKGKEYRYEEHRFREGGKVRSRSICLGAVGGNASEGWLRRQFPRNGGLDWAKIEGEELARQGREAAEKQAFAEKMHTLYGMNLTTSTAPIEKVVAEVVQENPSPESEGED